jgi:hypothetical protein
MKLDRMPSGMKTICCLSLLLMAGRASYDDFSFIEDEDLDIEVAARTSDIERTSRRIDQLEIRLVEAVTSVEKAQADLIEAEHLSAAKAGLLYRLLRHGRSLQYLFNAGSGTEFLRRADLLRRLVVSSLKRQRDCGLRFTETQTTLEELQRDMRMAKVMMTDLDDTLDELLLERNLRSSRGKDPNNP